MPEQREVDRLETLVRAAESEDAIGVLAAKRRRLVVGLFGALVSMIGAGIMASRGPWGPVLVLIAGLVFLPRFLPFLPPLTQRTRDRSRHN